MLYIVYIQSLLAKFRDGKHQVIDISFMEPGLIVTFGFSTSDRFLPQVCDEPIINAYPIGGMCCFIQAIVSAARDPAWAAG